MSTFTLTHTSHTFTEVPNYFLDHYMPGANGEFVKVYLCLLRSGDSLSVSLLADRLSCTENDIMRALRYWEQEGLLRLGFEKTVLKEVSLLDASPSRASAPKETSAETISKVAADQDPSALQSTSPEPMVLSTVSEYIPPEKPHYTTAQMNQFIKLDDVNQALYVAQRYLCRTLNSTETSTILYFYDSLGFPADLIEYLIEYCVSRDKKSMRYIEAVALSWAKQGIHTVEKAKEVSTFYNKNCFAVMKAFGLSNRNPANAEAGFIKKWTGSMGFSLDIILEACRRTIQAIHQPSFEYADSILTHWQEKGVHHLSDIQRVDQLRRDSKEAKPDKTTRTSNNRFNNMTPRSYLYEDLEKQLLGR